MALEEADPSAPTDDLVPDFSVLRWARAAQFDFAARMQWGLTPNFENANHHPNVAVDVKSDSNEGDTVTPNFENATHHPNAANDVKSRHCGHAGADAVYDSMTSVCACAGERIQLVARLSDPDAGDTVTPVWFVYKVRSFEALL